MKHAHFFLIILFIKMQVQHGAIFEFFLSILLYQCLKPAVDEHFPSFYWTHHITILRHFVLILDIGLSHCLLCLLLSLYQLLDTWPCKSAENFRCLQESLLFLQLWPSTLSLEIFLGQNSPRFLHITTHVKHGYCLKRWLLSITMYKMFSYEFVKFPLERIHYC